VILSRLQTTNDERNFAIQHNLPVEVALRWEDGKRIEGRYGEQVFYMLDDDRVMYVPPVAAQWFANSGFGRVRRIEEPLHPAGLANAEEAAASVPNGSVQNHRNGSTHRNSRPLDLQATPDGTPFRFR
jgi:hypothetical protein